MMKNKQDVIVTRDNVLIRKSILNILPAHMVSSFVMMFLFMIDVTLAGMFLTPVHIAAIGVSMPVIMFCMAFLGIISGGVNLLLTATIGRGDKEGASRMFSLGIIAPFLMGIFFVILIEIFAEPLVLLCGARDAALAENAVIYLRFYVLLMLYTGVGQTLGNVCSIYGYVGKYTIKTVIDIITNVFFSVLLLKTTSLGVGSLGLGTVISGAIGFLTSLVIIKSSKIPLKLKLYRYRAKEMLDVLGHGLPNTANSLLDSAVAGIINNLIVSFLGVNGLAISSVVGSISSVLRVPAMSSGMATGPLFGLFYGARDKQGLKKAFREGVVIGIVTSIVWVFLCMLAFPLLLSIYMKNAGNIENAEQIVRQGVWVMAAFLPANIIASFLGQFYQATERFKYSMLISIVPDSVIYPIMLALLLPSMGYTGLWLSRGGNALIYLLIMYLCYAVAKHTLKVPVDNILQFNEKLNISVPMFDMSIGYNNTDISGLSEKVHKFLLDEYGEKRTSYMTALCLEEIMADFIAHSEITAEKIKENGTFTDVKLFSDPDAFRIIIRNAAKPYNPLDFEYDDESFSKIGVKMAQKFAERIDYSYVYRMNIVTIYVAKKGAAAES